MNQQVRMSLETQLYEAGLAVQIDPILPQWSESAAMLTLIDTWRKLADYYEATSDQNISSRLIDEYEGYADNLDYIIYDEEYSPQSRRKAQIVLDHLKRQYRRVVKSDAAEQNILNHERSEWIEVHSNMLEGNCFDKVIFEN
jgi:hypothetical protein